MNLIIFRMALFLQCLLATMPTRAMAKLGSTQHYTNKQEKPAGSDTQLAGEEEKPGYAIQLTKQEVRGLQGCVVANPEWVGDGWCDQDGGYNTAACGWDGGDCCEETCDPSSKYDCSQPMDCIDPSIATCPTEIPEPGKSCSWSICNYEEITCCDGTSSFATTASCVDGTVQVVSAIISCSASGGYLGNCDEEACPVEKPNPGDSCSWTANSACSYDEVTCCDGNTDFATTAYCYDGTVWAVGGYIACSAYCDEEGCPIEKPNSGDSCSWTANTTCKYDEVTCCSGYSGHTYYADCNDGEVQVAVADIFCGAGGFC